MFVVALEAELDPETDGVVAEAPRMEPSELVAVGFGVVRTEPGTGGRDAFSMPLSLEVST